MTMITTNFGTFTDIDLTNSKGNMQELTHKSDQSDNPQNISVFYIGSIDSGKKLQAATNPGVDAITLTPVDVLPEWEQEQVVAVGYCVQPTTPNGKRYKVVIAGTTDDVEPTWGTSIGTQTVDGTVTWEYVSPKHETSEIKLALSEVGLDSATAGAQLQIATNTILGGTANKVAIYVQVNNAVNIASNNVATPELALRLNAVSEYDV